MAFTFDKISTSEDSCNQNCPENSSCSISGKCMCENGLFMKDGKCEETPENFCIYGFGDYSLTVGDAYADCTYEFDFKADPPNFRATQECLNGEYCILNWTQASCGTPIEPEGANQMHGRCAPYESQFTECKKKNEPALSDITPRAECENKNQYCNLQWNDENCTGMDAEGADYLYGICVDFADDSTICPTEQ